jgi:polysaccharide export outer membrane protein
VSSVPEGFESLKLAQGFLLEMDIFGVPEMTAQLRIDAQGDVTVPLIGKIHVEGDTVPQAQNAIAKALFDQEILKNPQVTLNILQFTAKNISVLGEVQNPGRVQLLSSQPLGNVLALAGGETIAAGSEIEIQRMTESGELATQHVHYVQGNDPAVLRSVLVSPGDTVLVRRAGVIYVLGAVNRPGGYLMVNGGTLSVVQAVSLAGGTTLQASTKYAVIVRRQEKGFVQFKVPLGKMQTGGATPIELQVNDALYIPASSWKTVLINGQTVLGAAASAAIVGAANY